MGCDRVDFGEGGCVDRGLASLVGDANILFLELLLGSGDGARPTCFFVSLF